MLSSLLHAAAIGTALASAQPFRATDPDPSQTLSGRVTAVDGGAAIMAARILVVEAGRSVETDADGRYTIPALPRASYTVSVSAIGFAPQVRRLTIADAPATADFTLKASLVELPALQVTSTPTASDPLTSPQPTAVLSGEDLHAAQAPSLGETLDQVAGVHSLSTGAGIGKPVIRGLTSTRVLVLDDGQRLETQQWGDEHGPNLETALADRIEVIRGPASVLYGSDALGGVVNVIPRPLASAAPGTSVLHGELSAAYQGNTRSPDGALLLDGATGAVGYRLEASGRTAGDVRTPDYTLWNSGNRAGGTSLALGVRQGWGSLTGSWSGRWERIELTDEDPAATPLQRIATGRGRLQGSFSLGSSSLSVDAGYERNRRREFEDATTPDVALGLLSQNYTLDARLHHAPLGPLQGILGVSGQRTTFDKFGEETLIPNTDVNAVGLYGFEQVHGRRLDVSFGARVDHRTLSLRDTTIAGISGDRSWSSVTGNLGLLYKLAEPAALVLNVGRGYRAPSSFDLFANGVHEGTVAFERGDPDLRTEKSLNSDLALRLQTTSAAVELGGFVNWVQDFIYTVPTGTTDPGSGFEIYDVTQGDARLAGLEFAGQVHPTRWLHLQGTADYVRGTNTSTGNPLPAMPPVRLTWEARLEAHPDGTVREPYLSFGGQHNGRQTRLDPAEAAFFADAFGGAGYQSEAYTLLNAGGGFTLALGGQDLHLDLLLRNLANTAYADFLSRIKTNARDPGMGRSVQLRLTTEF